MNVPRKTGSAGFSLVEMLVVIGIIAMLMGLIIPAMNAARSASRKAQCMANQKQIGLASLTFENVNERFPGYQHDLAGNKVGDRGADLAGHGHDREFSFLSTGHVHFRAPVRTSCRGGRSHESAVTLGRGG